RRLAAGAAEVRERAREGDVVDVVARGLREGAVLAPPGHSAVDELRVAGQAHVRTEAQALGHAGPETLDERVGFLYESQYRFDAVRVFEIDADRAPPARHRVDVLSREVARHLLGAIDTHD